jgi:hypothetical protein
MNVIKLVKPPTPKMPMEGGIVKQVGNSTSNTQRTNRTTPSKAREPTPIKVIKEVTPKKVVERVGNLRS